MKFQQLLFRKTFEEVAAAIASMNLTGIKDFLETETQYQEELRGKFKFLEISEKQFKEALAQVERPEFTTLAKVLKTGTIH